MYRPYLHTEVDEWCSRSLGHSRPADHQPDCSPCYMRTWPRSLGTSSASLSAHVQSCSAGTDHTCPELKKIFVQWSVLSWIRGGWETLVTPGWGVNFHTGGKYLRLTTFKTNNRHCLVSPLNNKHCFRSSSGHQLSLWLTMMNHTCAHREDVAPDSVFTLENIFSVQNTARVTAEGTNPVMRSFLYHLHIDVAQIWW